jgi:hypothetical protein
LSPNAAKCSRGAELAAPLVRLDVEELCAAAHLALLEQHVHGHDHTAGPQDPEVDDHILAYWVIFVIVALILGSTAVRDSTGALIASEMSAPPSLA